MRGFVSYSGCIVFLMLFAAQSGYAQTNSLERALESVNPMIRQVVKNSKEYELQVVFTAKNSNVETEQKEYQLETYGVDAEQYFYPASTVKLPMALMAAELISQHPSLEIDTPYKVGSDKDSYTVAEDIKLIFAISDDKAYNRLYELIGRDTLNRRMAELGFSQFRLAHRLATNNADAAERLRIVFYSPSGRITYQGSDTNVVPLGIGGLKKGDAFIKGGSLVRKPFDFSRKNYFPMVEQHRLLTEFISTPASSFRLGDNERAYILTSMAATPSLAGLKNKKYYDSYVKFFMFGDSEKSMPSHVKIYNKVGYAYGTLTDNAYIVDEKYGIEFFLSASLLVNRNRTFNDDSYQYDSVGIPFLAQLGREIYAIELAKLNSR